MSAPETNHALEKVESPLSRCVLKITEDLLGVEYVRNKTKNAKDILHACSICAEVVPGNIEGEHLGAVLKDVLMVLLNAVTGHVVHWLCILALLLLGVSQQVTQYFKQL